jgi:threonine dehydratase
MPEPHVAPTAILQALLRIAPYIRHTPLLYSDWLSERTGASVWLKPECWQPTGSFKVRGALNKVGLLVDTNQPRGIVTGSAGNHGLGVAYAARSWVSISAAETTSADIFVPATAPRTKIDKMRHLGAVVHEAGKTYEDAHQAAEAFARETGATYVAAYDDPDVIAGQGTAGLEILTELPEADVLLVPVGGGGLIAGIATAAKALSPDCQIVGVQPTASPAALLSLRDGIAYDPYDHEPTIADGLAGGFGSIPLAIVRGLVHEILLSSEADMRRAIYVLLDQHQLVVEASGAISIAPLLTGSINVAGKTVVCVLTGSNIETSLLREILEEHANTDT